MRHYNDGMVYTNENCIGCNKCISSCPITGANAAVVEDGKRKIAVSSDKCIHCGKCFNACVHGARSAKDDVEIFFNDLKEGKKISLLADPTFYLLYSDKAPQVFGYLKSLGLNLIYDVGFGAEISVWAHVRYVKEHMNEPGRRFIINNCSAQVNYYEVYNPEMLKYMIPVQSPSSCMALYAKIYNGDSASLAYLGPCLSRKDEMEQNDNIIRYNLTIEAFLDYLKDVDTTPFNADMDVKSRNVGSLLPMEGGFKFLTEMYFERNEIILQHSGIGAYNNVLKQIAESDIVRPVLMDLSICENGCFQGSGIRFSIDGFMNLQKNVQSIKDANIKFLSGSGSASENYRILCETMKDLDPEDFSFEYSSRYRQPYMIPDSAYDEIFETMHKDTDIKRHIDCGSCGYDSCYEMAKAIAYGYNKMENCIHYMNDELLIRYYTDPLTKIPNREGFISKVNKMYSENPEKTYVIGVISVNQLNVINDLHGFAYGDAVICKAASIASTFVEGRGVCARLGGGELLLCFENTHELMDRIHAAKTYTFEDLDVSFPMSFRAGLYVDADRKEKLDTMINYASLARDKIEEDGISTCLFYNDELRERLASEAMVTSQMYAAIERHEFVAYYQPQYSHRYQKIVGAETLCRWVKKDGSVISPGLFIPIFEKNGFIKTLDKYMWEQAFMAVKGWSSKNLRPIPISVNISRVSLAEEDFVDTIRELFKRYPIDPDLLHFEITESAYSARQDSVAKKIDALRSMGFKVAMDDFGSGYSSLNVLKDMPLDILKLDMGFLRGRNQERGESIIRNVVSMVKELQLDIISEGVETIDQAEFLKHVGCDTIQGYLYAKPMPRDEYETLIM